MPETNEVTVEQELEKANAKIADLKQKLSNQKDYAKGLRNQIDTLKAAGQGRKGVSGREMK